MSSNYNAYLDYLASFAYSHTMAVEAETNIYPLFADIKRVINHYKNTIEKFKNVQTELASFVEGLKYDETDFDYYQEKFKELKAIDNYLQELKSKKVPSSISNEVSQFIFKTYASTSLYELKEVESKVLAYHNKTTEAIKRRESQASTIKTLLKIAGVILFFAFLISKCNH